MCTRFTHALDRITRRAATRAGAVALAWTLLASAAFSADWYVDATHGSDTNDGATPSTAWKTVAHALAQLQAPNADTIHVAPGVYDVAQGETFPWALRDTLRLVGDGGFAATVVDGGGTATALIELVSSPFGPACCGTATELRGFTLRNAQVGVRAESTWAEVRPTIADLEITGMSSAGIELATPQIWTGIVHARIDRVHVHDCAVGVDATSYNWVGLWATDCEFSHNAGEGVSVACYIDAGVELHRTAIVANGSHGVRLDGEVIHYELTATLSDCLIARNGGDGLRAAQAAHLATQVVRRCTIADNAGAGVRDGAVTITSIASSILWNNGDDLVFDPSYPSAVSYCDVSDGHFAGASGNFVADPLFVNPSNGDYRLSWGSSCIERGDPATPSGSLDLARIARPIDGELDTLELPDVGAHEFAPLFLRGSGQIGTLIELESWGAAGTTSAVWWTRGALLAPSATPFGELELDRTKMMLLLVTAPQPGPPAVWQRMIPDDPALIGQTFAFQALSRSTAAPLGRALTNAVELHIVP